jgi:CRISPR-associated endoribonuclease Cas6
LVGCPADKEISMALRLANLAITLRTVEPVARRDVASLGPFLQGALMGLIDSSYAEHLHGTSINPYSQYIRLSEDEAKGQGQVLQWNISALNEEAAAQLHAPFLTGTVPELSLTTPGVKATVERISESAVVSAADLGSIFYSVADTSRFRLTFATPTAFRSDGEYVFWPSPRLVFQSLAMKHSAITANEEPDQGLIDELARAIRMTSYRLASQQFSIGGRWVPGFTGTATFTVRGAPTLRSYVAMLLRFGEFSGCGIKSSMGMGALEVSTSSRKERAA